jgi:hypothetical protein
VLPPESPPLPALTRAEGELIDQYLRAVDLLARINPTRRSDTYGALRAAQALVPAALDLRLALTTMHLRAEPELHTGVLAQALRVLDGERRTRRLLLQPDPHGPHHPHGPDGKPWPGGR